MNSAEGGVDYWGLTGWATAVLIYLSMAAYIVIHSPKKKRLGELERKQGVKRLMIVVTASTWSAIAIMLLTAHHGRLLRTMLSHISH